MTTPHTHSPTLLKPAKPVGIVGYGAYVPRFRLPAKEVSRVWTGGKGGLPIKEKAVPGLDEDVITMSIEAARNAMRRAQIDPHELRAVWVGSESHPYAVKPTSTLVAEAIGAVPNTQAAESHIGCVVDLCAARDVILSLGRQSGALGDLVRDDDVESVGASPGAKRDHQNAVAWLRLVKDGGKPDHSGARVGIPDHRDKEPGLDLFL